MKPTRWLLLPLLLAAGGASAELSAEQLQRYRADLDSLAAELPKRHANLFHTTPAAEFEREVDNLRSRLPQLDEAEALIGLVHLSTLARDGHTALFLLPFPGGPAVPGIRPLPIQFHAFDDGLRVIAADRAHADLLGATLTGVGDLSVDELRRRTGAANRQCSRRCTKRRMPAGPPGSSPCPARANTGSALAMARARRAGCAIPQNPTGTNAMPTDWCMRKST